MAENSTWKTLPADRGSLETLSASGLDYRVIDTADAAAFDPYLQAEMRGFLSGEQSDEQLAGMREGLAFRRFIGVYDAGSLERAQPVGTVNSWVTDVTLPGGRGIPMWAISGVTVAPTHRRKGIARAMLEGELRTAAAGGIAIAGLTVSEATIYGRFGFAPSTFATDWSIDTRRALWIGPRPDGRLDFMSREAARDELAALHDRVRQARPGEIQAWPGLWRRMTGLAPGQEGGKKLRAVRYADADGVTRGAVVYSIGEERDDFSKHELTISILLSETPDAYAALWRFVLEHDLVSVVKASLLSVDEPLRWMIADQRAATLRTSEHGWLRIIDVPAVLAARAYATDGDFVLRVTDPLGLAEGTWRLTIDDAGTGRATAADGEPDATFSAGALAAIVLGGVRAETLRTAGLVTGDPHSVATLDRSFAAAQTPHLGLWY
ncbi:GNAT family N-acetyltransferase [Microbacterium sp. DT81.1]|uniref:GNAT family N-acetyltransferase n=1 Tax=Microbacterium sp. DT81.1 TaxID=3393413 RepID=UPI003CF41A39